MNMHGHPLTRTLCIRCCWPCGRLGIWLGVGSGEEATAVFLKMKENDPKCEILELVAFVLEDFFSATALQKSKDRGERQRERFFSFFVSVLYIFYIHFEGKMSHPRYSKGQVVRIQ